MTTTYTKSGTGYAVTVDGELLGTVARQGRDRWVYSLSPDLRAQVVAARPWLRERDLVGSLGGYSREDATAALVQDAATLTRPLDA